MLFLGSFRAFLHACLSPTAEVGHVFPPEGISTIEVRDLPLYNTFIPIIPGLSLTRAHYALSVNQIKSVIDALLSTILPGFFSVILQMIEYYETAFSLSDSVHSRSLSTSTGLHGCHVIAGASSLVVCFIRLIKRQYMVNHYLGFVFAIRYWHSVDIVRTLLFLTIYRWGSW